jgi:RHS repeat-associated protein
MPTKIAFTGQYTDDTGLMFFQARYLSPLLGRFISADTIVPNPSNPQSLNRFSYTHNNPVKYTDPTGHCATDPVTFFLCLIAIGGGSFFAVDYIQQSSENYYEKGLSGGQEFHFTNIDWQRSAGATIDGVTTGAVTAVFPTGGIASALVRRGLMSGLAANITAGVLTGATSSTSGTIAGNLATGLMKGKRLDEIDLGENVVPNAVAGGLIGGFTQGLSSLVRSNANAAARSAQAVARQARHSKMWWDNVIDPQFAKPGNWEFTWRGLKGPIVDKPIYKVMQTLAQALGLPVPAPSLPNSRRHQDEP